MRLVPGSDLARSVRDHGPMPEQLALRILGQVVNALYAVHRKNLVHRDVKPHNVLVWDAGGEDEYAMLTDFGIAKAVDDTRNITGVGAVGSLLAGAPTALWQARILGAELFVGGTWRAEDMRAAFEAPFRSYEEHADPRPTLVPERFETEPVGKTVSLIVNTKPWELRLACVTVRNDG